MSELKTTIESAVKDAMRARDRARLATLRLVTAEFKRVEVDERLARQHAEEDGAGSIRPVLR